MSYCRPVGEIDLLVYGWIPPRLVKIYEDATLEEFVLEVRNGNIDSFMHDESYSDVDKIKISDEVVDVRNTLIINGFIRSEMLTSTPELYFVLNYIIKLDLVEDFEERFMPYFLSNEDYETYNFCYERIEAIIGVLACYLDSDEIYEVVMDIMSMGLARAEDTIVERAKRKMQDESRTLIKELEGAFTMF